MRRIYLDYSASTSLAPEVLEAMTPYFSQKFGNPSSSHSFGREAEIATDEAREILSRFFNVAFEEVYFTSGATEANNWVIHSVSSFQFPVSSHKPHVITSAFEHESVLEPIQYLEEKGFIEATYLKPSKEGFIDPADVEKALKENTVLISIIYVNNETGAVQPIKEIGKLIQKAKKGAFPLFHSDAVQAIQFYEPRLDYLKLDAMTVSAHKVYGPKGAGALIARKEIPLTPLLRGGGQEFEKRSGTLNVSGIVGFGKAIELLQETGGREREALRLKGLKTHLQSGIKKVMPQVKAVCFKDPVAPHILSIIFPGIEAQVMLIALDQEGIAVSSGAACSVKAVKPSHVLRAMGYSERDALSAIRFSFGRYTKESDIKKTVNTLEKIIKQFKQR